MSNSDNNRVNIIDRRRVDESIGSDIRRGLASYPKWLPTKYLYDDFGSKLFNRICELPEYYPTRTEYALLKHVAEEIVSATKADELVELGSGMAHKTRILIDAFLGQRKMLHYVPVDISESALRTSTAALVEEYPMLQIEGIICDYTVDLNELNPRNRCLVTFLGSTIGNFTPAETAVLLSDLNSRLSQGDWFLLGVDLVKPIDVLETAYNDAEGVTAAFNKNILSVTNRELGANFNLDAFDHFAFFNSESSRIEMHLIANQTVDAHLSKLDFEVHFDKDEHVLTEISRKFTRPEVEKMLEHSGFRLQSWFMSDDEYFALALSSVGNSR